VQEIEADAAVVFIGTGGRLDDATAPVPPICWV
jgi:hypothetical protein